MSEPTKVTEGDTIKFKFRGRMQEEKVKPPCENKRNGAWYCTTHNLRLDEFGKSEHYDKRGPHLMAWLCFEHGFEQP